MTLPDQLSLERFAASVVEKLPEAGIDNQVDRLCWLFRYRLGTDHACDLICAARDRAAGMPDSSVQLGIELRARNRELVLPPVLPDEVAEEAVRLKAAGFTYRDVCLRLGVSRYKVEKWVRLAKQA